MNNKRYKVGQWIYGIRIFEDDKNLDISGYLYMGRCKNFIICTKENGKFLEDFNSQLDDMYKNYLSHNREDFYGGIKVHFLKEEFTFDDYDEAKDNYEELCKEYDKIWKKELEDEYYNFIKTHKGKKWEKSYEERYGAEVLGDFNDYLYDFYPDMLQ